MRFVQMTFSVLALAGLILVLAACAQMRALPSMPASHSETLTAGKQVDCSECHEDQQQGTMKAFATFSHSPSFVKNHRHYAAADERLCAACHKSSFCNDCHTNKVELRPSMKYGHRPDRDMPHRGDFLTLHKIEGKLDPASCYRCHGRSNNESCTVCHR